MSKIVREEMIKAANTLIAGCAQLSCENCPFEKDKDEYFRWCKLSGAHPLDWQDVPEDNKDSKAKRITVTTEGFVSDGSLDNEIKKFREIQDNEDKETKETKTVPLDFDIKEDRELLRGKTLIKDNPLRHGDKEECEVKGFFYDASDERYKVVISDLWGTCAAYCEENLLWGFVFADTGKPVGKVIEI